MALETYREADVAYLLTDAGVRVRASGVTTHGVFKAEGVRVLDAEGGSGVLASEITVTIRTGSLDLSISSALEVANLAGDWTAYVVRDYAAIGDGAMTRYTLAEA